MAKEENKDPKPTKVKCAYCGKELDLSEACSYGEHDQEDWNIEYFCGPACAFAKLFGIIRKTREFVLGMENGR
jgi:hypothetical protein